MGIKFVAVTLGPDGCFYRRGDLTGYARTYDTKVLDTTGSGDAFWGAALFKMAEPGFDIADAEAGEIADIMDYANAAGAFCATGFGAIPSLARPEDIEAVRKTVPLLK